MRLVSVGLLMLRLLTSLLCRFVNRSRRSNARGNLPFSRSDAERLIKQTYSVHVSLPEDRPRGITRKWHLSERRVLPAFGAAH